MAKAKKITKKPSLAVKSLKAPERNPENHVMATSWKIPNDLINTKKNDRATELKITWSLGIPGKDPKHVEIEKNEKTVTDTINLNDLKINKKTTYTRNSFYPIHKKRKLTYVTVKVQAKNKKGTHEGAHATRKFKAPRKPTLTPLSFDTSTGIISTTVDTDPGNDYQERYDTKFNLTVTNPFVNNGKEFNVYRDDVDTTNPKCDHTTSTSKTISYDASNYMNLDPDTQFIKVVATAWARGYAGDSEKPHKTRTAYISYPAKASIENIVCPGGRDSTGKCTILIKTNSTTEHPVDSVRLEVAADVIYDDPNDIPSSDWESTEIVDNKNCTAMSIATSELIPTRGNYTYIRLKTHHLHEDVLYRYSDPKRVEELELKTAPSASIDVDIINVRAGADGKSAIVLLGWNKDGLDDYTGTELSWSDDINTWKSTEEPNIHQFTWSDGQYPATGTVEYHDSAEITIKGLDEGSTYYIKARRYLEADNEQYSDYTLPETVTTNERPESIVADCTRFIAEDEPLTIKWTLVGNGLQSNWSIDRVVNNELDGTNVANGKGSTGSVQISASRIAELATNGTLSFKVSASTGSEPVVSDIKSVTIRPKPTLSISAPSIMTTQSPPYSFTATSSQLCDLIVIITAQGASGQFPQGEMAQAAGDTIHSDVYSPTWTNGSAEITIPGGLDFWDGGKYTLSVVAVDRTTRLKSPEVPADFSVAWTNQAVAPVQLSYAATTDTTVIEDEAYYELVEGDYILVTPDGTENPYSEGWYTQNSTSYVTLTVIDEKDADGDHIQAVKIELTPPTGSSETDVYDIYRMDIETPSLIGESFPLTYTAIDEYAPFGTDDLRYRIALRTIDGDVEFSDIEYVAECKNIRFDWAGGSLELPYGNTIADSFKKDSDVRKHMNGISNGYWRQGIERKSSLNSAIIKIIQPKDIERTRMLARYTGPVFVRLPNGSAFEADVQVTDLSVKNEAVTTVAFDATEIGLTNEFLLPTPFKLEEE